MHVRQSVIRHVRAGDAMREPLSLGVLPAGRVMETTDERVVRAPPREVFEVVRRVEE